MGETVSLTLPIVAKCTMSLLAITGEKVSIM